ncbi:MAG TPA: hypothetical protein VL907_15850 [Pyrinomonadaceae bacterium]|nr:hypothetical protein [Pyrinomonadaceae bacterium]
MKEELFENPVELRTAVSSPHFDDRRVVLRAQPVVPLNQIRSKLRLRRLWFLSGAFAVAMMLGAASALVTVRVKRSAAVADVPQIQEPDDTTPATQYATVENVDSTVADNTALGDNSTAITEEAPAPHRSRPIVSTPNREEEAWEQRPRVVGRDRETFGRQPSEDEQLEQIREAVLYEKWQERRARRAARRERRNRLGERDLSRVDEIFEGTRRGQRP